MGKEKQVGSPTKDVSEVGVIAVYVLETIKSLKLRYELGWLHRNVMSSKVLTACGVTAASRN